MTITILWNDFKKKQFRIFEKNFNPFFVIKIPFFGCHNKSISQNEECHTSLSSVFSFQSIGILTWKFIIFPIFRKKSDATPTKNEKIGQKINFQIIPENLEAVALLV